MQIKGVRFVYASREINLVNHFREKIISRENNLARKINLAKFLKLITHCRQMRSNRFRLSPLYQAIVDGNEHLVQDILKSKPRIHKQLSPSPFAAAAARPNASIMTSLLQFAPFALNWTFNISNQTLLQIAIHHKQANTALAIIDFAQTAAPDGKKPFLYLVLNHESKIHCEELQQALDAGLPIVANAIRVIMVCQFKQYDNEPTICLQILQWIIDHNYCHGYQCLLKDLCFWVTVEKAIDMALNQKAFGFVIYFFSELNQQCADLLNLGNRVYRECPLEILAEILTKQENRLFVDWDTIMNPYDASKVKLLCKCEKQVSCEFEFSSVLSDVLDKQCPYVLGSIIYLNPYIRHNVGYCDGFFNRMNLDTIRDIASRYKLRVLWSIINRLTDPVILQCFIDCNVTIHLERIEPINLLSKPHMSSEMLQLFCRCDGLDVGEILYLVTNWLENKDYDEMVENFFESHSVLTQSKLSLFQNVLQWLDDDTFEHRALLAPSMFPTRVTNNSFINYIDAMLHFQPRSETLKRGWIRPSELLSEETHLEPLIRVGNILQKHNIRLVTKEAPIYKSITIPRWAFDLWGLQWVQQAMTSHNIPQLMSLLHLNRAYRFLKPLNVYLTIDYRIGDTEYIPELVFGCLLRFQMVCIDDRFFTGHSFRVTRCYIHKTLETAMSDWISYWDAVANRILQCMQRVNPLSTIILDYTDRTHEIQSYGEYMGKIITKLPIQPRPHEAF